MAIRYDYRSDFQRHSTKEYIAAYNNLWLDEVCAHMKRKPPTPKDPRANESNAIYIWQAVGLEGNAGDGIYKIGVTSLRRGEVRIDEVARPNGFAARLVVLAETIEPVHLVEKIVLSIGEKYFVASRSSGGHEFRRMSEAQLRRAVDVVLFHSKQTAA